MNAQKQIFTKGMRKPNHQILAGRGNVSKEGTAKMALKESMEDIVVNKTLTPSTQEQVLNGLVCLRGVASAGFSIRPTCGVDTARKHLVPVPPTIR